MISVNACASEIADEHSTDDGKGCEKLSLTGVALAQLVLKEMNKLNLNLDQFCVGIGTDGCSVMLGQHTGAVQEIQKKAKNAIMTPCHAHKLNRGLAQSTKVRIIEKAHSLMTEVTYFFITCYPKRNIVLSRVLGRRLVRLCETRWIERHDAVLQFIKELPKIMEAL